MPLTRFEECWPLLTEWLPELAQNLNIVTLTLLPINCGVLTSLLLPHLSSSLRLLFDHLERIEHQFLSGIRDSRNARSLWGMMTVMWGVRKSIHQSWLAKGLGLGLLYLGFKGIQEEIPSEKASTLQIGSLALIPGQCTSSSILVTDYLTKMDIKTVRHPPYSPDLAPCDFWLFPKLRGCRYETIEEMVYWLPYSSHTSHHPSQTPWLP